MRHPFFSIIIPSLNEEKNIVMLLTSIVNQTIKDFEIIIADSSSTDNTKTNVFSFKNKILRLLFLQKKFKNVSSARNYGAGKAKGKFLIFLDADVIPEEKFLEQIKEKVISLNLDAATVWNRAKTNALTGRFILTLMNLSMSLFQKIKPAANGPCIIIKKELFQRVNGFDERIVFGEDFDLIQRINKLKAKFRVFRKPILYVSTRRFEKEGFFLSLYKSIKALFYQLFFGPIRKPIFEYQMGGQYYKSQNSNGKKQDQRGKN